MSTEYIVSQAQLYIDDPAKVFIMQAQETNFGRVRNLKFEIMSKYLEIKNEFDQVEMRPLSTSSMTLSGELLDMNIMKLLSAAGVSSTNDLTSLVRPTVTNNGDVYKVKEITVTAGVGTDPDRYEVHLDRVFDLTVLGDVDDEVYAYPITGRNVDWEETIPGASMASNIVNGISVSVFNSVDSWIGTFPVAEVVLVPAGANPVTDPAHHVLYLHGLAFADLTLAQVQKRFPIGSKIGFADFADGQKPCQTVVAARVVFPMQSKSGNMILLTVIAPKAQFVTETLTVQSSHTEQTVVSFQLVPNMIDVESLGTKHNPPKDTRLEIFRPDRIPVLFEKTLIPHNCVIYGE